MEREYLVDKICEIIDIVPNQKDKQFIADRINGGKSDAMEKANTICEYFDVEKRRNRLEIFNLLTA